jgi:outer membrane protein
MRPNVKRNVPAALCVALLLIPPQARSTASPAIPSPISIETAVHTALENNPSIIAATADVARQRGVLEERKAAYAPTITSQAQDIYYDKASNFSFDGETITLQQQNQRTITVGAGVPIDIAGQIGAAVDQARLDRLSAECVLASTRNNVVAQVRTEYYDVLLRRALVQAAKDDLANSDARLATVEAQVKAGTSAKVDVLRATADDDLASDDVMQAQRNVDQAMSQLRLTMGLDDTAPLEVADVDPSVLPGPLTRDTKLEQRPEVLKAEVNYRAAKLGMRLARASYQPSLTLGYGYRRSPDTSTLSGPSDIFQVTATLTVPIYDGGTAAAREAQAKAGVQEAQAILDDARLQSEFDERQARIDLANATQRVPVAQAAVTSAQESYGLAAMRFTEGVSPQVELTDAQAALTRARTDLIDAQWTVLIAQIEYDRAMGRWAWGNSQ